MEEAPAQGSVIGYFSKDNRFLWENDSIPIFQRHFIDHNLARKSYFPD